MFKVYFLDCGVCNYFQKNFSNVSLRQDSGALFETVVLSQLNIIYNEIEIKFWRTKQGQEVDFIIQKNTLLLGFEVKYKTKLKSTDFRGITSIMNRYRGEFKLVSLAMQDTTKTQFPFF